MALQFTKDFYYLDADMQNYVCEELAQGSAVDDYLYAKRKEAYERGFSTNRLRHLFTELHVADATEDGGPVRMHVSGTYRVAINPVFMVVGKIFFLADEYHMDETLELVKEDDGWESVRTTFRPVSPRPDRHSRIDTGWNCNRVVRQKRRRPFFIYMPDIKKKQRIRVFRQGGRSAGKIAAIQALAGDFVRLDITTIDENLPPIIPGKSDGKKTENTRGGDK